MLIFLPGYQEIMDVKDAIVDKFGEDRLKIVLLHSTITAN
jgi:HrpA-like RNA helicase